MSYLYDLHTHSHCSDGQLSPTELVALAKLNKVDVLALTDHDTIVGVQEAKMAAGDDLHIISGIELSSVWNGRNIHVVGLNIDIESEALIAALEEQAQARLDRAKMIAQRLEKAGIQGVWEGVQHYAKDGNIGRPHFAQYLVDADYVDSFAQAFKRYLGAGKIGDVKQQWPELDKVIAWINAAGGVAVLAHPDKYDMTRTKLYSLLQDFVDAGGRGIEIVSGRQEPGVTSKLIRAALDFSLLISCGSDFHSSEGGWQLPGKMSDIPCGYKAVWDEWDLFRAASA
ncbi:MAG: PHP domain-containing protein [Cellvibrionaceae bacterium]